MSVPCSPPFPRPCSLAMPRGPRTPSLHHTITNRHDNAPGFETLISKTLAPHARCCKMRAAAPLAAAFKLQEPSAQALAQLHSGATTWTDFLSLHQARQLLHKAEGSAWPVGKGRPGESIMSCEAQSSTTTFCKRLTEDPLFWWYPMRRILKSEGCWIMSAEPY